MKQGLWVLVIFVIGLTGFFGGYAVSSRTGVMPGYFEAAEAGGYGGGGDKVKGLSDEMQDYYKDLYKEE